MTNVLKCNECNIVIKELLSYIQNKVSVADEETLIRICTSAFTTEEIKNAKSLLFDSISSVKRKIVRKNKGKEERDLADIINLFKSADPDVIPVFVSRQLDKLPPILFDHLDCTKILKDILLSKSEVGDIKKTYASVDALQLVKFEFLRLRNESLPPASAFKVNAKRGAWIDSGPMGLSHDFNYNSSANESCENGNRQSPDNKKPSYRSMRVDAQTVRKILSPAAVERDDQASSECYAGGALSAKAMTQTPGQVRSSDASAVVTSPASSSPLPQPCAGEQRTATASVSGGGIVNEGPIGMHEEQSTQNNDGNGWQTVIQRKKSNKYRFVGKSGVARDLACSFRAAERKIPMFITNVHTSTTESDIIKHIYNKTQETVSLEKINMKFERGHKAYKFLILQSNLPKYLDEKLWPDGVIFRRFVHFKDSRTNSCASRTTGGSKYTNNG